MHKKILFSLLFCILIFTLKAQRGNNGLSINGEIGIPIFQQDHGFGFFLKGAHATGTSGQFTMSAGVSIFYSTDVAMATNTTTRLIPFLFGYKQNIRNFFIEPGIGLGELGGKISVHGDYSRPSIAAVFGGVTAGYTIKRIQLGMKFLTAHGIENSSAGTWYNKNFHYTSIFIGYDLFSKVKR